MSNVVIEKTDQLTIGNILRANAERFGAETFLLFEDRKYTYAEVDALTNRLANGLASQGVRKGDHVAVMLDNGVEILFSLFALGKLGAVAVPINTAAKGRLLEYFLLQSKSIALIVDGKYIERFSEVRPAVGAVRLAVVVDGNVEGIDGGISFDTLYDLDDTPPPTQVQFKDLALLMYTSGTTGPSKACMYTQAHTLKWAITFAKEFGYRADDTMYVCLPLFHGNALHTATYGMMMVGGKVAIARKFSASGYWRDIDRYRATITNLLGSMGDILWKQPVTPEEQSNSLRQWMMAPTPRYAQEAMQRYQLKITNGFGLTDFAVSHYFGPDAPIEKLGSVGTIHADFECRIADEDDFELPRGQVGEILLRSKTAWHGASGYYDMPEATTRANRNQWFHTGDFGYVDEDGYLYFTDRKKDSIRRRGENVSAFEVEQILMDHPNVKEACVYAVRTEGDEEVGATLILNAGVTPDEPDIIAFCQSRMAYYMVPRFLQFVDSFPRNTSEKVEKHKVRSQAEADLSQLWDRVAAGIVVSR
ncbi:CoA ligase [Caballeronia jiangsuensis]|nr:CoA ligase [Caballeronia jiangsuensis]